MRISNAISGCALAISIVAIILSVSSDRSISEEELSLFVDARIAERGRIFVERYAPAVKAIAKDFGTFDEDQTWSPRTIEELITPLTSIIADIEENPPNKPEAGNGVEASGQSERP